MKRIYLYIIIIIFATSITYVTQYQILTDGVLVDHFSKQFSIQQIEQLLDFRDKWAWINYVILPIIYLLKFTFCDV